MRRALAAVVLALSLRALGCGPGALPTEGSVVLDLVEAFPDTGAAAPTSTLVATDRAHFLQGWSPPGPGPDARPVAWIAGSRGVVWFDAGVTPVDQRLVIACIAEAEAGRPRPVLVRLNRAALGTLRPAVGAQEQSLGLPAARQTPGRNLLEFFVPGGLARRRGMTGARALGVVSLRFEPARPLAPAPRASGNRLFLPPGGSVAYFLDVPAEARLVVGAPEGVRVSIEADGRRARDVRAAPPQAGGEAVFDLGPEAGSVARLTLATVRDAATLVRPRVVGRPAPATEEPLSLPPASRANVVLYVADTLRADRLGCYGYGRPTSPNLDAFAREALLFENAVAQSSWTRPAAASILTGRWAHEHGAASLMGALRTDVPTLAEVLHAAGYTTGAVVTNLNVAARFGFDRGFDTYQYLPERDERDTVYASAAELDAVAFPWLDAHPGGPFFLYLHASDPHAPYRPPPEVAARFVAPEAAARIDPHVPLRRLLARPELATPDVVAALSGLYDGDVAVLDQGVGELLARLRALGLDRTTLVVFVADHGEEFGEHGGLEHGRTLYGEVTRVPLLVRWPGGTGGGRRVIRLARQIDVVPTILAAVGVSAPPDLPGRSLVGGTPPATESVMETELGARSVAGMVTGRWKAVWNEAPQAAELYDLAADPGETRDLARARPVALGFARQRLARLRRGALRAAAEETTVTDPETERRLRALGYLD